ncbi:MAG: hypothetical protein ACR2N0_16225 [Rubrobacteraceae bacterium]
MATRALTTAKARANAPFRRSCVHAVNTTSEEEAARERSTKRKVSPRTSLFRAAPEASGPSAAPSRSAPFRGVAGVSEKSVKIRVKPETARRRSEERRRANLPHRRAPPGQSFFEDDDDEAEEVEEEESDLSDLSDFFDSFEESPEPFFESPFEESDFAAESEDSLLAAGSALLFPE